MHHTLARQDWVIALGHGELSQGTGQQPLAPSLTSALPTQTICPGMENNPLWSHSNHKNNRNFLVAIYVCVYMYTCSPATLKALSFHPVQKLGPLAIPTKQPQTVMIKSIFLSASFFLIGMMLSFPINTNKYCIQTMPLPATR